MKAESRSLTGFAPRRWKDLFAILGAGQDHGWSRFVRADKEFLFDTGSELGKNLPSKQYYIQCNKNMKQLEITQMSIDR